MRLLTLTILALTLTACGSFDTPDIPDPVTTGQLVVAYDIDTQVIVLEPRDTPDCPDVPGYDGEGAIMQGTEGIGARAYYGLEPGDYCLTWGFRYETGGDAWRAEGNMPIRVQAGALDFVSVVPVPVEEPAP